MDHYNPLTCHYVRWVQHSQSLKKNLTEVPNAFTAKCVPLILSILARCFFSTSWMMLSVSTLFIGGFLSPELLPIKIFFKSYPMFYCSLYSPKKWWTHSKNFPAENGRPTGKNRVLGPFWKKKKAPKNWQRAMSDLLHCKLSFRWIGLVPGEDAMWANLKGW